MKTSTGVVLNKTEMAIYLDHVAKRYKLPVQCFVATFPNGRQEYVLLENGELVFTSQQMEAVDARLTAMGLSK